MKQTLKLIPITALVAALSACHQGGVGVDSGASQKAATSAENALRSDRSIQQNTTAQASIQMPAAALALQAFQQYGKSVNLPPARAGLSPALRELQNQGLAGIWDAIQTGPSQIEQPATAQKYGAVAIASMAHPWQGWPYSCFGCAKEGTWARGMAQQVVFSNIVLSEILPRLSAQTLADPAAAQAAIIAAYKAIPSAQLIDAYKQAGQQVQGGISFDFTGSGPAPIHYQIGDNDFQASPAGWKWTMSGVPWFGEGRVSGKDVELSLASAIDKSQSQTSGTGTSTGTSTEQGAGGSAGVK